MLLIYTIYVDRVNLIGIVLLSKLFPMPIKIHVTVYIMITTKTNLYPG